MKLSCALVLTLANLVIATPFSFSVKGSGASAKAEAATSPFGQFGVVKPVASVPSGISGSFSKSSSASFASSSASSSSSAFNYNAGQVGTASLGYGSQGLLAPNKNVAPQVVALPQTTAFATAGSNSQTGASVNAQGAESYSSEKGNEFSGNLNVPANVQYQSAVPESKPNSYVSLSSGVPSHWHEHSKPNNFNTNEHSEKSKETFGVQSFSNNLQSGTTAFSTPAAPSQGSASIENAPPYAGGFGGPPGILIPHDKISSVGSKPANNGFLSYPSGAQLNVPNKQQTFINTPVNTGNPPFVQHDYPAGNINPTVQSINNEYILQTENSKPSYKPEIKPSYLEQNKPTASNNYDGAINKWQHNSGHVTLQPQAETSYTQKETGQVVHSIGHFSSHGDKPFANNHDSKPIKNVQIFIQPVPSNAPQATYNPVQFTNTQIVSENKKEVKPTNQLQYSGGFGAPEGVLKPSGQSVSSGQTFSSSPVKIDQYDSSSVGLTTTGAKENTYNTGFGGLLNEGKETAQPSLQVTNDHSYNSGSDSATYVTPKPSSSSLFASSPSVQVGYDYVSKEQKGTEQFLDKPSESSVVNPLVSSWAQNPTVNSLPIKPESEVQKKPTGQYFLNTPSPSSYTPEQGLGGVSLSIDKTKPAILSGNFEQVSEDAKPTIQSPITNNGFGYTNTPSKPVFTPTTPHFETTKEKESSFVSYTTTQPTPAYSWQQSTTTYKPTFEGTKPGYFDNQKTSPTKYPSLTDDYTVSKQTEQYVTSNVNQQSSNYGSTAASFVSQEPAAQVNFASPTLTSFAQESTYKPSIENSLATSSASQESHKTTPQNPLTGTFTVSKEVYKVPTQIVSNNVYPPGSVASVVHLIPNSEISQSQPSHQHQQSANYEGTTSFVTQKPTAVNFVGQTTDATSGLTSAGITQQSNKPTVSSLLTTSSVSGSYVSSNVYPTQKPFYSESFSVPKETQSDTISKVDSTVGTAPAFNLNGFTGKPQIGVSQQSVEYKPASSFVTKEPTASVNIPSQTISSTSAISQSTTISEQSPNKPTVENSKETSPSSGFPKIPETTPSKNPQYQLSTKPTAEKGPQKQPVYSNVFGTLTGAVKPSTYFPSSTTSTRYPWSSSNSWSGPSYVTGSYDKPKQTTYYNQYKPTASRFPEKKETLVPTNQPYFTGNFASNIPTTAKPSVPVASLNVAQQSSSSITTQKEKETTATSTSGSGTTYSKPISSNSGFYTAFASPKPTSPTNQLTTSSAFSSFGSSFSQVKPQYQFSTVQPFTQKKQWYTNNYETHGTVKPHTYTYPGFSSSFTTFGQGSVGGLYDKTKQTQYPSTGQYKPTSTGQYSPSQTGQYKPISTGQYKPTYNWGFAGQSQFQKPNQPTQTGGSYVSTYTQTTSKPFVTLSSLDKQKPTGEASVVSQKESTISSSFVSSTGVEKPTNQASASYAVVKPTSSGTSFESVTGTPSLTNVSDKDKNTASVVSQYDLQKPVNPTVQTVSNTYATSSFISAKPTNFQSTGTSLLENKPTNSYPVQQVVPSVQTIAPTKVVENSELGQSYKPTWSSSNKKETSYSSSTGVATSITNPTTPSVDGSDNSQYVDKTQTSPVKVTSTVDFVGETASSISKDSVQKEIPQVASGSFSSQKPLNQQNGQIGSIYQESIPVAQENPSLQQFSKPYSTGVSYQGNTEFHSHSQAQPAPAKPDYPNTFGESWAQSTPQKEISGSLESNTPEQKGSVQHVHKEQIHSKPTNTLFISPWQPQESKPVVSLGSSTSQFPKVPSTVYFGSKPNKVQYTTQNVQTGYKPTSVVGAISTYDNQQKPTIIPTLQETYSNIPVSGPTKPPGQYWALNTQSSAQQNAFQATKPNIKVTVVGKPTSTIVIPQYSGGFGGPSGILKPNEFGISPSQGNTQSQVQVTSGVYSGAQVETNSNTASYSGGFSGPSGVFKPDEKHSLYHAGHDKPSFNGVQVGTSQNGAQASYNVVHTYPTAGAQVYIKEQTGHSNQVSSEVHGTPVTNVVPSAATDVPTNYEASAVSNAAANASGFSNSNGYASSGEVGKTSTSFTGQFGALNGFSANAKGSAVAAYSGAGVGGAFPYASILGRR